MLKLNGYVGQDESLNDEKTAQLFAKRYALRFWCGVLPFVTFFSTILWASRFKADEIYAFNLGWLCGLTILAYIHFIYRCPRCGEVPYSSTPGTTGVLLFPKKCCKCHAPLLPDHKWGQD